MIFFFKLLFNLMLALSFGAEPPRLAHLGPVESMTSTESIALFTLVEKDKSTIIDFWASWCGPCKESLPLLEKLQRNNAKVKVILLNLDEEKKDGLEFLKDQPMLKTMAVYFDRKKAIASALGVEAIPSTFIFSPQGELKKKIRGYRSSTHDEILMAL